MASSDYAKTMGGALQVALVELFQSGRYHHVRGSGCAGGAIKVRGVVNYFALSGESDCSLLKPWPRGRRRNHVDNKK